MLRPGFGRCLAAITCRRTQLQLITVCVCVCVCVFVCTYPNHNVVLDLLPLLLGLVAVVAHELRLQHVTRASVLTEEGAVQLSVFIWGTRQKRAKRAKLLLIRGQIRGKRGL